MIKIIVQLYRGAIGFIFVLGILLAVAFISAYGSSAGFASATAVLLGTVLLTGISAVLISINDHLAALRERK